MFKKIFLALVIFLIAQNSTVYAYEKKNEDKKVNRTEYSEQKFKELFGEKEFSQSITDPDLYEISKKFIYGDVVQFGNLTVKQRALITIVTLTANGQTNILKDYVNGALNVDVTPVEIKEAIYQTAPYAGIPKAVEASKAANEVFKSRKIKLPVKSQRTVTEENRFEKGLNAQVEIFGERMRNAKASYPESQQHIPQYLSEYCFGDFYTREGLDLKTRELLTLCMLVTLGDTESQIKGHIQGNLNMGNDKETMTAAITQCLPYIGFPRTLNALKYLNEAVPE